MQGGISDLTFPLEPSPENSLQPGQSRRVDVSLADPLGGSPAPAGATLSRVVAVHEVCPPDARYTPAPLDCLTLFLTRHGRAEVRVGSGVFSHQPGALVAAASGCRIAEQVAPAQPWHLCYLQIAGPWADQMDGWLRGQNPPVKVFPDVPARRRQVFVEIVELALAQTDGWSWLLLSRCAELLGGLYADARAGSPGEALVAQVARLLDAAPDERPTVAQMAARLGLTPRQLLYQFGKAAGEPLALWTRRRRVAAARRLLSQGLSVTQAAEQLGYANPYHFSRVFKAVTGVPPSAVRAGGAGLHTRTKLPAEEENE